jgi:mannose-6-phosphate isomerase-like protein (cupin superfamily)
VPDSGHRRVVSGKTAEGKWGVLHDGGATATESYVIDGAPFDVVHFWNARALSLETTDHAGEATLSQIFTLAPGSSRFFIESMEPTAAPTTWHRTNTIDYEYIVSGRIDLMMEDGSAVTLEAGDVNIQLGGMHQWWNHDAEPCVFFCVMVGIESEEEPGAPEAPGSSSGPPVDGPG